MTLGLAVNATIFSGYNQSQTTLITQIADILRIIDTRIYVKFELFNPLRRHKMTSRKKFLGRIIEAA